MDNINIRDNYASVSLEPESAMLTNFGRRTGPLAETTRKAKEQAFGVYVQDYQAEQDREEAYKKQKEEQKAALKRQLITSAVTMAATSVATAAVAGASSGVQGVKQANPNATSWDKIVGGVKGIGVGGDINGSGVNTGGLKNLFTSIGKFGTGDFSGANNYYKLSQISDVGQLNKLASDASFSKFFGNMADVSGAPKGIVVGSTVNSATKALGRVQAGRTSEIYDNSTVGFDQSSYGLAGAKEANQITRELNRQSLRDAGYSELAIKNMPFWDTEYVDRMLRVKGFDSQNDIWLKSGQTVLPPRATGGLISRRAIGGLLPETSAIDTIPTMLSGGEFIMNRAATQNIGSGNLQALNAGAKGMVSEEKSEDMNNALLKKLDELIEVSGSAGGINITVNSTTGETQTSSSGEQSNTQAQMAQKIKDVVLKVIQDEKRLGGQLRGGMGR